MFRSHFAQSYRALTLAVFSLLLVSCGGGSGPASISASSTGGGQGDPVGGFTLVFQDDFGGPNGSPRLQGRVPLALSSPNWRVETGYGVNGSGWGNDEWQLYRNSIENLYTENGNLVISAQCSTAPNCEKRDGSITSARINSQDRFNVRYGKIQARIKMPSGLGMWPAFWALGSDFPDLNWPNAGEIDIVEMHYFYSDTSTTHFTTHWAAPEYAPGTRPVCASGVRGVNDGVNGVLEEQHCFTKSKTFDTPLTDDFHVFELVWDEKSITGKIDDITYYTLPIDPSTMEEFLKDYFLILNVAVGGTLGGQNGPQMSTADWADPNQTNMLVDWVRVFERAPAGVATLVDDSSNSIEYNRIINSAEFNGAFVESDITSTAVTPLVGNAVLEAKYSTSVSENGGVPAPFSGLLFDLNRLDLSSFSKFVFSMDLSQFPALENIEVVLQDTPSVPGGGALPGMRFVNLSDYPPTPTTGNWMTYEIPLSDFVGVDLNDLVGIGFANPRDTADALAAGTLFLDGMRFVADACTPNPTVTFDSLDYNPATIVGAVDVSDACAASSEVSVKIDNGADEIYIGVHLDAAGNGRGVFNITAPASVCRSDDETSVLSLSDTLTATYSKNDASGTQLFMAEATAGLDPLAPPTSIEGDAAYIYTSDSSQQLAFVPDTNFNFSDFGTGSQFDGNVTSDSTFSPVFAVSNANNIGVLALFNFTAGFAVNAESINFKVKNMPQNTVEVRFGDPATGFTVDLLTYPGSRLIGDGWYEVSVPISTFPNIGQNTFVQFTSANTAGAFTYLITDIFLQQAAGSIGLECSAPVTPQATIAENPDNVIALQSSLYPNVTVDTWSAGFDTAELVPEVQLGTETIQRYSSLGFAAIETVSEPIDASGMSHFRIDVWSPNISELLIKLVDFGGDGFGGANDTEGSVTVPIAQGEWVTLGIPLASFSGLAPSRNDLSQIILESIGGMGSLYVGNVYFVNTAPPPPPSLPLGVYSETNTGSTLAYSQIINGADFGGNQTVADPVSTAVTPFDGSVVLSVDFQDTGATYGGAIFEFGGADISAYAALRFAIDTSAVASYSDLTVQLEDGSNAPNVFLSNYTPTTQGNWSIYEIPLADFGGVNLSNITLLGFWNLSSTVGSVTLTFGTIYLDDIHFVTSLTPPPPPPPPTGDALGVYSETNTNPVLAYSQIINGADFGGNQTIADENSTAVTPFDGSVVLSVDYQDTGASYGGAIFDFGGGDVSAYDSLRFAVDTSAVTDFADLVVQLEDGSNAPNVFLSNYTPAVNGNWAVYEIPLADFGGVNLANITLLGFWNMSSAAGTVTLTYGILYFDDIHFLGASTPSNTLGLYSETNTTPVLTYNSVINGADFGGNQTVADENSTAVSPFEGAVVLSVDFQDSGASYGGAIFDIAGGDVSAYTALRFAIDTSAVASFADLVIQLEDGSNAPNVFLSSYTPTATQGNWSVYEIPLADFGGVNLTNITLLGFWNMSSTTGTVTLTFGTLYLDDIHFTGSSGGGGSGGANLAANGDFEAADLSSWNPIQNGGTAVADNSVNNGGSWSMNLVAGESAGPVIVQQLNMGIGTVASGDTIDVSFDAIGTVGVSCALNAELISEGAGGGQSGFLSPPVVSDLATWTPFSFSATTTGDVAGGVTVQVVLACGAVVGAAADVNIDNVTVTIQ